MTTTETTTPAAWIGCLACYNSGTLRGRWITARQAADEVAADEITYGQQTETVTTHETGTPYTAPRCRKCGGDEFDVFDTEHLPTKTTLREFYETAEQLADLDDAGNLERIATLAAWIGTTDLAELIAYDEENYAGQYDTFQEFAEQYAHDANLLSTVPEHIAYYFDYEKYANDLQHNYLYDLPTGHTWISR